MTFQNLKFKKYLGVDWGEKRIGLALGDSETKIATPFKVVGSVEEIVKAVKEEDVQEVVIGKPVSLIGGKYQMTKGFSDFVNHLKKRIEIPIIMVDERLTSKAADKLEGSKKFKAPRDAVAAMIILQSYLDKP